MRVRSVAGRSTAYLSFQEFTIVRRVKLTVQTASISKQSVKKMSSLKQHLIFYRKFINTKLINQTKSNLYNDSILYTIDKNLFFFVARYKKYKKKKLWAVWSKKKINLIYHSLSEMYKRFIPFIKHTDLTLHHVRLWTVTFLYNNNKNKNVSLIWNY